jgi:hypothetical protein
MSISHRLQRSVVLCGLVCVGLMITTAGVAAAAPESHLYAQAESYSSYGNPENSAALAQEQYLGSYGEPDPLDPPQSPIASDDVPWLAIVLSIAGGLVIVAASATQLRRLRVRRRRAAGSAA